MIHRNIFCIVVRETEERWRGLVPNRAEKIGDLLVMVEKSK